MSETKPRDFSFHRLGEEPRTIPLTPEQVMANELRELRERVDSLERAVAVALHIVNSLPSSEDS